MSLVQVTTPTPQPAAELSLFLYTSVLDSLHPSTLMQPFTLENRSLMAGPFLRVQILLEEV